MGRNGFVLFLIFMVLFGGFFSSASPTPPTRIVSGVFSNAVSSLIKWLWSLKTTTKIAMFTRSMMKLESGYTMEMVFDGSKLEITPYSVEVLPAGEILVLDFASFTGKDFFSSLQYRLWVAIAI